MLRFNTSKVSESAFPDDQTRVADRAKRLATVLLPSTSSRYVLLIEFARSFWTPANRYVRNSSEMSPVFTSKELSGRAHSPEAKIPRRIASPYMDGNSAESAENRRACGRIADARINCIHIIRFWGGHLIKKRKSLVSESEGAKPNPGSFDGRASTRR